MTDESERREIARRAARQLQAGLDDLAAAATEVEEATGQRVLHRRPSILDAQRADIDHITRQATSWLLAVAVVNRWLLPARDKRTVGALLKVLPRDEQLKLLGHLHDAGALDNGPVP